MHGSIDGESNANANQIDAEFNSINGGDKTDYIHQIRIFEAVSVK